MSDNSKVMRWGVIIAAAIIVVRIVLEQLGAPNGINNIFGVAWMYFILPILFALGARARDDAAPYKSLLKNVLFFAVYTRVMVMMTYMLAYIFHWKAQRFAYPGSKVGEDVGVWTGIFTYPLLNLLIWIVMAAIIGMIIGSITLLLKKKEKS